MKWQLQYNAGFFTNVKANYRERAIKWLKMLNKHVSFLTVDQQTLIVDEYIRI